MASSTKDWRKNVSLSPIAGITFNNDPLENKATAYMTIKNMSEEPILFKVKTTMPVNYLVRPNQGIIKIGEEAAVKIIFNFALDSPVSVPPKHLILFKFSKKQRQSRVTSSLCNSHQCWLRMLI